MERVLSPDERLRRAEQIYYQRKGVNVNQKEKTVNVPISNRRYIARKMIIQIIICLLVYCTFYCIKNFNFIFSKEVVDKTSEILSYDIDVQDAYCKVANYIKNYEYFNKKEEQEIEETVLETTNENEELSEEEAKTKVDTLAATEVVAEDITYDEGNTNQMQEDANEIKQKYLLINPVEGQITSKFGTREVTADVVSPYHVGLDIAANIGTVIASSMEGEVVYSGILDGYGNCIQIQKDDVLTIYGHCSKLYVNKGDKITQGQKIGEVGSTGNSTGPHLHFEIRKDGRYVDPQLILIQE